MDKFIRRQRGGTILGLIIGLMVGLGIAVVVALVITNSTLPFTDKMGKPDKSPATGATQAVDPNKPLYGNKDPIREAAKAFNKPPESKPPEETPPAEIITAEEAVKKSDTAAAKPDSKGAANKTAATKEDVGEARPNASTKADASATPATPATPATLYYLQAGAFRDQNDAEGIRAKLALLGFEARITERPSENGALYRVRIGPLSQLETMNRARTKLAENGIDAAVIRSTK